MGSAKACVVRRAEKRGVAAQSGGAAVGGCSPLGAKRRQARRERRGAPGAEGEENLHAGGDGGAQGDERTLWEKVRQQAGDHLGRR